MPDTVPAVPTISNGRPLRVLLVDDTSTDRELTREALAGHEQAVILDTCASGERALSFLRAPDTTLPDVILLDLNMPGLTSLEVLAQLKDDPSLQILPVVILSSSGDTRDIERAYSLHASSYLIKTPQFQRFVRQIDAFVNFWMRSCTPSGFRTVT
ncbi:CheY-like chemotaxis protein [Deinococcus metalli]|uniref:CheY-like chemotaxis protein n=1 Tax=Deinococcus metalli TaxID=1141878 RepID=A0A7W8NQ47_9DEIO|nr:response regulator [Deinococcus metalli]MBB5378649.1 CheY-like chemotaxis protein [Deinococcus metalli]GHF61407.1 response regulator [Deinococcus metalli]